MPLMAGTLRMKGLLLREMEGSVKAYFGGAFHWWEDIDGSPEWQKTIFSTLCALYALVAVVALVQLLRIQFRVPEYGWTTQKVFHLMNFVVNGLRAALFGFYESVFLLSSKALEMFLLDLPTLLFFSTYTLLVLFWAEIYHQARSLPLTKLRPSYYVINGIIYFTQVCIWLSIRVSKTHVSEEVAKLFLSAISFCAALGFLTYGGRLFVLLRHFPIESRGRQKKLNEYAVCFWLCFSSLCKVGFVTGVCCTCFLIRCIMVGLSAFQEGAEVDVLNHPILNLLFYLVVEITPSVLVLFILRKLPRRRVSDQYHPIH